MANSFVFTDWVAPECLRLLENMLELASLANTDHRGEFEKDFAIGDTTRIKFPQEWLVTDGMEFNSQAIARQYTTATMDNWLQIGFEWDSLEKALKMERSKSEISEQYLKPAMAQMAQEMELRFVKYAILNTNNVVGALGTTPTAWSTYAAARTRLVENAGWGASPKRGMGVSPQMMETMISNSLTQFNPTDAISSQYKQGSVGKAAGFDWYETMAYLPFTTGIIATQASVTVKGANQSGSQITLNCTTGDTFKQGDRINLAAVNNVNPRTRQSTGRLKQFVVTQAATGASSAVTLNIYPSIVGPGSPYQNVDALPADTAAVTFWPGTTITNAAAKKGILGLALNKLAFAMIGTELPNPKQGGSIEVSAQKTDDNTGLSIALISAFDPVLRRWINRFDALIGFGTLYADRCSVVVGSLA